jgi:hypothetical protein
MVNAFNQSTTSLWHEDNDEQQKKNYHQYGIYRLKSCMIYPENRAKEAWDFFMTIILLITCVLTPLSIAFQAEGGKNGI